MSHTATMPAAQPTVLVVRNRQVREASATAAAGLDGGDVRLDFRAVDFVESRELGALVVLNRKVRMAGGRLALVNVGPEVADVFGVTRLDTILDVRPAADR